MIFNGEFHDFDKSEPWVWHNVSMKSRVLSLNMGASFVSLAKDQAGDLNLTVCSGESEAENQGLISEGPWDVVVARFVDVGVGLELLTDLLSGDLFTQVIFVGKDLAVKDAVILMRAGSWAVIDEAEESLMEVLEAIGVAAEERKEDMDLVSGSES